MDTSRQACGFDQFRTRNLDGLFFHLGLLLLGFGLVAHGLRYSFSPSPDFLQALFIVGSALCTVGLSGIEAQGPARWALVIAGFSGLSVLTMAVTYLLEVQEGISRRDSGILALTTAAGEPPSALGLLECYADLNSPEEIRRVLYGGRDWCASVLQSHASHPSLIYFRSASVGAGWPATLGAMMDLALILELLIDDPGSLAPAILLRSEGLRLIDELNRVVGLDPLVDDTIGASVPQLCARLAAAGYKLRPSIDALTFTERRRWHATCVQAAAEHLGTAAAPLLP